MAETLDIFVRRLSNQIGCYYRQNSRNYSLRAFDSLQGGSAGVFAWVKEHASSSVFSIAVHKQLAEESKVMKLIDRDGNDGMLPDKKELLKETMPTVYFFVENESERSDYRRVTKALVAIMDLKKQNPSL